MHCPDCFGKDIRSASGHVLKGSWHRVISVVSGRCGGGDLSCLRAAVCIVLEQCAGGGLLNLESLQICGFEFFIFISFPTLVEGKP